MNKLFAELPDAVCHERILAAAALRQAARLVSAAREVLSDNDTYLFLRDWLELPLRCRLCGQWRDSCEILTRHGGQEDGTCKYCRGKKGLGKEPATAGVDAAATVKLRNKLAHVEAKHQRLVEQMAEVESALREAGMKGQHGWTHTVRRLKLALAGTKRKARRIL